MGVYAYTAHCQFLAQTLFVVGLEYEIADIYGDGQEGAGNVRREFVSGTGKRREELAPCHIVLPQLRLNITIVQFFFFSSRRRHTRWTGDWSSDVCSSD